MKKVFELLHSYAQAFWNICEVNRCDHNPMYVYMCMLVFMCLCSCKLQCTGVHDEEQRHQLSTFTVCNDGSQWSTESCSLELLWQQVSWSLSFFSTDYECCMTSFINGSFH